MYTDRLVAAQTTQQLLRLLPHKMSDITCHMCYQATPYRSDQGADLGWHVRDLDKYMTVDYLQTIEDVHIIIDNLAQ
jgi:hypothetical protein